MWKSGFPQGNGYYWVRYTYNSKPYVCLALISNVYWLVEVECGIRKRRRDTHIRLFLGKKWCDVKVSYVQKKVYKYNDEFRAEQIYLEDFKYWNHIVDLVPNLDYKDLKDG